MHSGDLGVIGEVGLTDVEKNALLQVMQRAKVSLHDGKNVISEQRLSSLAALQEFDQTNAHKAAQENPPLEGTLQKWTNVVKGWQPRWIRLDQQQAVIHYYASEDRKKQAPRGSLHLWGAVVAQSDDDTQTFTISGANGEEYRLRASDAKERQHWVVRLRKEIEDATNILRGTKESPRLPTVQLDNPSKASSRTEQAPGAAKGPAPAVTSNQSKSPPPPPPSRPAPYVPPHHTPKSPSHPTTQGGKIQEKYTPTTNMENISIDFGEGADLPGGDAMFELFTRVYCTKESLMLQLESCVPCGLDPLEKNVLLLKATSHAAIAGIKDCLSCLKNELLEGSYEHLNKDTSVVEHASSASDLGRHQGGDSHKLRRKHKTTTAI